jgi:hypothetical protein
MTEEEYTKIQLRYSRASDLTCEINENKRIISSIERGQYQVDVYVDACRISHELDDECITKIRALVLKHYQNKLREAKQKFEKL